MIKPFLIATFPLVIGSLTACSDMDTSRQTLIHLTADRSSYSISDTIVVTIRNSAATSAEFGLCLQLEEKQQQNWTNLYEKEDVACAAGPSRILDAEDSIVLNYVPPFPVSSGTFRLRLDTSPRWENATNLKQKNIVSPAFVYE